MNSDLVNIILAVSVFLIYWFLVIIFKNKLEKRGISSIGPILMIRSKRGLNLLDKLAKHRTFWRRLANIGIPLVFVGMAYMMFLILTMDYILLTTPPAPSPATSPRNILLIPGLNEFVPFLWGLIGLIVTLVVHEFSHAILARVEGVKVKSLGVILALVPIGGFAEPDEKELIEKTNRIQKLRIYSAGITANFCVALIAFFVFFNLLGFLKPHVVVVKSFNSSIAEDGDVILEINGLEVKNHQDVLKALNSDILHLKIRKQNGVVKNVTVEKIAGVYIIGVLKGYPAESTGLKAGMVVLSVNGIETPNTAIFTKIMKKTKPNETITLILLENGTIRNVTLKLVGKNGHGFMGVLIGGDYLSDMIIGYSEQILTNLKSIPRDLRGLLYVTAMPLYFRSFDGITNYFTPTGFWKDLGDVIFWLLNAFYWIAWLNFYIGLFNCLPAVPLDGGRVLSETLQSFMRVEKAELIVKTLAIFVFLSILLSIVIPNLASL